MVSCSDKDEVNVADVNRTYDLIPGQNSWLAVGIALPDDGSSTRANEDLVDGLAAEFEVKSAKLILFKGGTEATATYFGEYVLTPSFTNEANDKVPEGNLEGSEASGYGEITTTSQRYVTEIDNPELGAEDKLWAYAILNYDGNATGISANGKTFAAFSRDVFKAIGIGTEAKGQGAIGEKGLVMTSVPIASKAGGASEPAGDTKITTLSEVQSNAIFETREEAEKTDNPLTCIYVERAAVKVELKNSVAKIKDSDVAFEVQGWYLGNVNNNASGYYNTRQFSTDWLSYANNNAPTNTKYRMLGRTGFWNTGTHTPTGYRTYFGEDVNYGGNTGLIFQTLTDADYVAFNNEVGAQNITYTYENTMDENSMIYQNTTYVGIKAQIGDGADFWVEEGQPGTKLDDAEDIAIRVKANASTTFDEALATINAAISNDLSAADPDDPTVSTSTIIKAAGVGKNEIDEVSYDLDAVVTLGTVDETTAEQAYTYQIVINNIKAKKAGAEVTIAADKKDAFEAAVKALATDVTTATDRTTAAKFFKYADGISYYSARIAHFGGGDLPSGDKNFANGETPWSAPSEAYNQYDKIYPKDGQSLHTTPINYGVSRAAAWLGRWGIVRNNWYVLDIKQVEGFGSPVPEDYSGTGIGNTPDDNPERSYFIAAEIHILPWAKRYQSVKF